MYIYVYNTHIYSLKTAWRHIAKLRLCNTFKKRDDIADDFKSNGEDWLRNSLENCFTLQKCCGRVPGDSLHCGEIWRQFSRAEYLSCPQLQWTKAFLSHSYHVQLAVWWYLKPPVHLTSAYVFSDKLVEELVSLCVGGLLILLRVSLIDLFSKKRNCTQSCLKSILILFAVVLQLFYVFQSWEHLSCSFAERGLCGFCLYNALWNGTVIKW